MIKKIITKTDDKEIKYIKSLKNKKYRYQYGTFYDEGIKNIIDAYDSKAVIEKLFVSEELSANKRILDIESEEKFIVKKNVFNKISDSVTPQGIIATFKIPDLDLEGKEIDDKFIILLDGLQDSGNVGTILRTAEAFGIRTIFVKKNTVDPYSPKVVRASMGSIYRLKLYKIDNLDIINPINFRIFTTSLEAKNTLEDLKFAERNIFVFGNEGNGVSKEVIEKSDSLFKIPMRGKVDSLNVAITAGIVIHEITKSLE